MNALEKHRMEKVANGYRMPFSSFRTNHAVYHSVRAEIIKIIYKIAPDDSPYLGRNVENFFFYPFRQLINHFILDTLLYNSIEQSCAAPHCSELSTMLSNRAIYTSKNKPRLKYKSRTQPFIRQFH